MAITVKTITHKQSWEKFVLLQPQANFLHSWNWGEFHQNLGKQVVRTGFYQQSKLIGVMLSVVEPAKRATYLIVPGGPLLDWNNQKLVQLFKHTVTHIAKENHCSFVRVRPQILENSENDQLFKHLGFRPAPMHLHAELTHQLNLLPKTDTLIKNMRKTTRYEIHKAEKLGINITQSTNDSEIRNFYRLQLQTAKRQKFIPFSYKFLHQQFKTFVKDKQVKLYTASLKGKLLTQAFIIFYGQEADYHYSASSELNHKYPGSYLLLWQAIKDAKSKGYKRFNFWGVAPENDHTHRFYGVSVFKRGFRGEDIEYLHARDLIISPFRYTLNYLIESLRKFTRRL